MARKPSENSSDNVIDEQPVSESIMEQESLSVAAAQQHQRAVLPAFHDEFVGQGGSYVIDPVTGVRRRATETFTANDGTKQSRSIR